LRARIALALLLVGAAPDRFRVRMRDHWQLASAAQSAVIQGDLPGARAAAARLADLSTEDVGPRLDPGLPRLVSAALALESAGDLPTAALAVAGLGGVCGDCHTVNGRGPGDAVVPRSEWSDEAPMPRHQLAADDLWLGIVAPSDVAWSRGARELATTRIPIPDPALAERQDEVARLAARALESTEDRGLVYAEILATCADCHDAVHQAR
jgi:mono/diheme cytochrome c family protein